MQNKYYVGKNIKISSEQTELLLECFCRDISLIEAGRFALVSKETACKSYNDFRIFMAHNMQKALSTSSEQPSFSAMSVKLSFPSIIAACAARRTLLLIC